ncbi:MAG: alpha/beta fold hydrolase [Deltaproteobacteria bacterium]|nr:alpha/beta fold hydrolase [Deltaproteobacteria bacterium]
MTVRIFIHGLESSNQGTKGLFFKREFPDMIIPNFPGTLQERMRKLNRTLSKQSGIRLVGSSFGGLMATLFALENESRVERMILLAPALNLMAFSDARERESSVPTWIYHGKDDKVIPLGTIEGVAKKTFRHLTLHVADDDHYLHKTFKGIDWQELLN